MIGQLCDGFGTPLVAYHADKLRGKFYGKRKTIHLIGTAIISIIFPFIFTRCAGCEDASTWALVLYFIPLVAVFEVAWASVQMSHLSLIPELTSDPKQRDELNIIRYTTCFLVIVLAEVSHKELILCFAVHFTLLIGMAAKSWAHCRCIFLPTPF